MRLIPHGRRYPLIAILLTVAAGLWVRSAAFPASRFSAQLLGAALWAVALYWLIRALSPRRGIGAIAGATLILSWTIELLQLTPLPRTLSSIHPLLKLAFGETFDPIDLLMLFVGVCAAALSDAACRRARL